jgi:hypothetical protein
LQHFTGPPGAKENDDEIVMSVSPNHFALDQAGPSNHVCVNPVRRSNTIDARAPIIGGGFFGCSNGLIRLIGGPLRGHGCPDCNSSQKYRPGYPSKDCDDQNYAE